MSGYEVTPAELFAAQAQVSESVDELRAELARLRAAADDLLEHGWRGAAATAFGAGWREWDDGARLVLAGLDETAQALGLTAREYERTELDTAVTVRGAA